MPSVTAESPEDRLEAIGIEPLVVDLTRPASSPYVVVRALAPGLVPIAFGWDREPLGLEAGESTASHRSRAHRRKRPERPRRRSG